MNAELPRRMDCTLCALHKSCRSVFVPTEVVRKRNHPLVMFIGEAPGEEEDKKCQPFVGKSGKILRSVIHGMGIQSYAIANVVRCRPPQNRTPSQKEIKTCGQYLDTEVESLAPAYLVLLGSSAVRWTGEKGGVELSRGRRNWVYHNAQVLSTYHPAYLLRVPQKKDDFISDLNRLNEEPQPPNAEEVKWEQVGSVRTLPSTLAFDVETTGLNPWKKDSKVLCVSWSSGWDSARCTTNVQSFVKCLMGKAKVALIGHNVKFDLKWLAVHHGLKIKPEWVIGDTQILAHLLNEELPSYSLGYLASVHTNLGPYKEEVANERGKGNMDEVPEKTLLRYCCTDSVATWRLWNLLSLESNKQLSLMKKYRDFRMALTKTLLEIELSGIPLNVESSSKALVDCGLLIEADQCSMSNIVHQYISMDTVCPSWASPTQVGKFFTDIGYTLDRKTKTGRIAAGSEDLANMRAPDFLPKKTKEALPLFQKHMEELRGEIKTRGYLRNFQTIFLEQGSPIIHPTFKQTSVRTGRLSCADPNLQNIPREGTSLVRSVFQTQPGWVFVQADYSQIELRVAALLTRDENLLHAYQTGEDLHWKTARAVYGPNATKDHRTVAKTINFGIFYGAGPERISKEAGVSLSEAAELIRGWYRLYPGVRSWQRNIETELKEKGEIVTPLGRVRHLPIVPLGGSWKAQAAYAHVMRQAVNFPIQSIASDITCMALMGIPKCLKFPISATVHDSILLQCPEDQIAMTCRTVSRIMTNPRDLIRQTLGIDFDFDVPLEVEISTGPSWAGMEVVQ